MKRLPHASAGAVIVLLFLQPGHAAEGPELLVDWNAQVLAAAQAEDRLLTLKGVRTAAIMHLAIHDALNCTQRRYGAYAFEADGTGADGVAAATEAAYTVLLDQYPQLHAGWRRTRAKWLATTAPGAARDRGIALGAQAAAAVLARRAGDGWNREATYEFQPMAPGVYAEFSEHSGTPQGFVFGAGWAAVRPFALRSPDQFRSPAPPAVSSAAYLRAFNEVREVGRFESRTRTADQTHLALWWKDFVESSHNRLARQLVTDEHTELWTAARLFALLNVSVFDSYVAAFDNKFFYNHWRPFTAIRRAEHDGNPATVAEPDWNNTHRHTYAFPSYPSAHGTACAAAMAAFADTFGDRHYIRMSTPEVDAAGPMSRRIAMKPATRSFDSFSAAALECALSRVYLGIHFRYDSLEGNRLGNRIGGFVTATLLRPR
jgi:membrane-associated phospholipid phosphatase